MTVNETVQQMIARILDIPLSDVTDKLRYQSRHEWDSMAQVELMLAIEARHGEPIAEGIEEVCLDSVAAIRAFCACRETAQTGATPDSAQQQIITNPSPSAAEPTLKRGLNGVILDETAISRINGEAGTLDYRGYPIQELVENATFEEVAWTLLHGDLPEPSQLAAFDAELKAGRWVPATILNLLADLRDAHPMDALRSGVSALAAFEPDRADNSRAATLRKGVRLIAALPTLVAAHHALRQNRRPLEPDDRLPHAANFLYMLTADCPDAQAARLMDCDLILHAEHGANASAFAARIATGTGADLHAAMTAAIAVFFGPLHGGAPENVMQMAREIGTPEQAGAYIRQLRAQGKPVMGFGHRVYKTADPRALHFCRLLETYQSACAETPQWYAVLQAVVQEMAPLARYGLNVNVDFYVGVLYELLGIPQDLASPIFVLGRAAGWLAHVLEQQENNILIRPLLRSVGPQGRAYMPLHARQGGNHAC